MRSKLEIKEINNSIDGEYGQNISSSGNIEAMKFDKNYEAQLDLSVNGFKSGENYFASTFKPCDKNRAKKQVEMKNHFNEILAGKKEVANKGEQLLVDGFKAIKRGEFGSFLNNQIINNSAEDPQTLGGTAFLMPSLAKMMGENYTMEATLGTTTTSGGSQQTFTIEDFCKTKTNSTFEYAPEIAYTLQSKPNIFSSYNEIENQITDQPGSQSPLNTMNNYDYQFEVRKLKTHSVSKTLQYNLLQMAQLQGYYGIDQIAQKQDSALRYFDEIYYYNGMNKLFNNNAFRQEKASSTIASDIDERSVLAMAGMVDTTGKVVVDFDSVVNASDVVKQQFCKGFREWKDNRFGNKSMTDGVLVLPLSTFILWDVTSYVTSNNLNRFMRIDTFKEYFEYCTGIKVMPLNLIDPLFRSEFGDFSLVEDDCKKAFFYDRDMFEYITTKQFKQFNTWGTADNVNFTTIYEGEFVNVFCPYYNQDMDEQRIPAVAIKIYSGAIPTNNTRSVSNEAVSLKISSNNKKSVK